MPILLALCQFYLQIFSSFVQFLFGSLCFAPDFGGQRKRLEEELVKVKAGSFWNTGWYRSTKNGAGVSPTLSARNTFNSVTLTF